ncbi:MAG: hypothetical protein PHY29_04975 [Syntrophales bacterium]|nr:hypothetical protein [Syntrophales bacterium]
MAQYIGAVDQGTTSSHFIIFDHSGKIVSLDQVVRTRSILRR